jgi:hypothetical protein
MDNNMEYRAAMRRRLAERMAEMNGGGRYAPDKEPVQPDTYVCLNCPFETPDEDALNDHVNSEHPEDYGDAL